MPTAPDAAEVPSGWRVDVASPTNAADVADLARLRFAWRAGEGDEAGLDEAAFATAFAAWWDAHAHTHVALLGRENGVALAMGWLALVDRVPGPGVFVRRCAYVQSVYVAPAHRNAGRGADLMEHLIDHARREGLDYLAVHPSTFSFTFYRRLGFDPTNRVLELDFRPRPEPF